MRTAHISALHNRWMCDLFDETGARVSGCYGTSEQVDRFVATQSEEVKTVKDERDMDSHGSSEECDVTTERIAKGECNEG